MGGGRRHTPGCESSSVGVFLTVKCIFLLDTWIEASSRLCQVLHRWGRLSPWAGDSLGTSGIPAEGVVGRDGECGWVAGAAGGVQGPLGPLTQVPS